MVGDFRAVTKQCCWLIAVSLVVAACSVDTVREDLAASFERPEVTERFEDPETEDDTAEDSTPSDDEDEDEDDGSRAGVEFRAPLDPLEGLRPSGGGGDDDATDGVADLTGEGEWTTIASVNGAEVSITAELELDLFELEDTQLVGLGILTESEVDVPRDTRWFRVDGALHWDLPNTSCAPSSEVDGCEISLATDGSVVGLGSLEGNALTASLSWRTLGRNDEPGVPELEVVVIDARGERITHMVDALRVSAEAAFIDWEFRIEVDGGPRPFTAIGAEGSGTLRFDRR